MPCPSSPRSRLLLLLALLALWRVEALHAQDKAAALQDAAKQLGETKKLVEAEQSYLAAVAEYEKRIAQQPGELAHRLEWCRCRNRLADLQVVMQRFAAARALLTGTVASLHELSARQPNDAAVRLELAKTHASLSHCYQQAELPVEAVAEQVEAIKLLEKLADEFPARADCRGDLADTLRNHGTELMALARYREAEAVFQKAVRVAQRLAAESPKEPEQVARLAGAHNAYALLVRESGRFLQAAEMIREAVRLLKGLEADFPDRPKHWRTLPVLYRNLAQPLGYLHQDAEKEAAEREARRLDAKLAAFPDPAEKSSDEDKLLATLLSRDIARLADQQAEVDRIYREAQELSARHPDVPVYLARLAAAKLLLSLRALAGGSVAAAQPLFRESQELFAKLAAAAPDVPKFQHLLANAHSLSAMGAFAAGDNAAAEPDFRASFNILGKLADAHPGAPSYRLAQSEMLIRVVLLKQGQDPRGAVRYLREAAAVMKRLAEEFPACPDYRRHNAQTPITLANLLLKLQQHAEAEPLFRDGIRLWAEALAAFPENREFRRYHGEALMHLGRFLADRGRDREAEEAFAEGIRIHQRLADDFPQEPDYRVMVGGAHHWLGTHLENRKRFAEALESYNRSVACLEAVLRANPRQRDWLNHLQLALRQRAFVYFNLQRSQEYEKDLQRAKEIGDHLLPPLVRLSRIRQRIQDGDWTGAVGEADDTALGDDLSETQWRELAGLYARLSESARDAAAKESAAAHAVESLRKALAAGYASPVPLAEDVQFRELAARADFRALPKGR